MKISLVFLVLGCLLVQISSSQAPVFQYLTFTDQTYLPAFDDGLSPPIYVPDGIPFGNSHPRYLWIDTNGIISFGEAFSHWSPQIFPGTSASVRNGYLVTPFWDDIDISGGGGSVYYQVFTSGNGSDSTNVNTVNAYINSVHGDSNFTGTWMLLVKWDHVSPYPHGSFQSPIFFPDIYENNTFQAIVITDSSSKTYTIFTFFCGDLNWARGPTIGYNAASQFYINHPATGADDADTIACTNGPETYYHVVYNISADDFVTPEPPTPIEPAQASYLEWLEHTGVNAGELNPCDDCSSDEIQLPVNVPFGNYFHNSVYVGANGVISFGEGFSSFQPSLFPTESAATYYDYALAPYWTDNDARLNGRVSWEFYSTGETSETDAILSKINTFLNENTNETIFSGNFVFVGFWEEMHPYPAGENEEQAQPYLMHNNTYQGIFITNGTKSYAIYTFKCGTLNWAGEGIIGFNAAGDYYVNHPLAGLSISLLVACVHSDVGSVWNNVIYDIVPNPDSLSSEPTPLPFTTIGTCAAANITECCEGEGCIGSPQDCFCDNNCFFFSDCCRDIGDICTFVAPNATEYLVFASHSTINHIEFSGNNFGILLGPLSGGAFGLDFHYSAGKLYWTDYIQNTIYRSDLNGENIEIVVSNQIDQPDDVAVDWVNDKLYWVDSLWARIEVMDIRAGGNGERAEIIKLTNHTIPRGIAVDPLTKLMFWTDWGEFPKVERASMDGQDRQVVISSGLGEPYGITIDYGSQRIYWADNNEDRIEFSYYDGTGRTVLVGAAQGVVDPFGLTIYQDLLYWTDWQYNGVYGTHKVHGTNPIGNFTDVVQVYSGLLVNPNGIEAISSTRQPVPSGGSPCTNNSCPHLCLLSSLESSGYKCVCSMNTILSPDGSTCIDDPNPTVPPLNNGTCTAAGYSACCEIGFCAGYPASCFCDYDCHQRGDCCHDVSTTCAEIVGSCIDAGYDSCCVSGGCEGVPADSNCYCDSPCLNFDDCCEDFQQICPGGNPTVSPTVSPPAAYLPYLNLSDSGVPSIALPQLDDGLSGEIIVEDGLPFGTNHPIAIWIETNGIFSFNEAYSHWSPEVFPGTTPDVTNRYLIAPFWDDVDISGTDGGSVYYQVHRMGTNVPSNALIAQVNSFINVVQDPDFTGVWLLVAMWDHVHPYPHGTIPDPSFNPEVNEENTFQAVIITDHTSQSYAIFTYKCGDLNWASGPTIGFNAASEFYQNFALTGSTNADTMDCLNFPTSDYFNIVYNISAENFVAPPPLPTAEPSQASYLEFLVHTDVNSGSIIGCDDCSSPGINLTTSIPFGKYYHNSAYFSTNGVLSFGVEFSHFSATLFPTDSAVTYFDYVLAPYWADQDTRLNGRVSWESYTSGDSAQTDTIGAKINTFVNMNTNETDFSGNFVLVGFWEEMHPYPAGASQGQAEPYLNSNNTYQAVVITDGVSRSYAIFTYKCGTLNWAGEATIGYNAGGDYYENHPLSGLSFSNVIACVHNNSEPERSEWNNVIYNLVPNPELLTTDPTPVPPTTIGSCAAAGYTECCSDDSCVGSPEDCYCDVSCFLFSDCCTDVTSICTFDLPTGEFLLFASLTTINHIDLNGENFNIFISQLSGGAYGLDFHYSNGYVYWSDTIENTIYRANLSTGLNQEAVVTTNIPAPEDIAVDWVSNKLYWIDSLWARIEVMDMNSRRRAEVIRTSNQSIPRAIALDPLARYMFWTDWGASPFIEKASMDGKGRIVLHSTGINQPLGITCDFSTQRIYWTDNAFDRIEYSFYDGSGRTVLVTGSDGVQTPFDLTIWEDLLYWTDWGENAVYGTHKIHGTNPAGNLTAAVVIHSGLVLAPTGIEAVSPSRQPTGENACQFNLCEHICLLSAVGSDGQSCVCESGYVLNDDQRTCSVDPTPTSSPTSNGSCSASGYTGCCEIGFCAGYPPNCFCDNNCYIRGDCCSDIDSTCDEGLGPCQSAGYDTCCTDGSCFVSSETCYCDATCFQYDDCCSDFQLICPGGTPVPTSTPLPSVFLPFLPLRNNGVPTTALPAADGGISDEIPVPNLPFGNSIQTSAWVANDGILSFGEPYTHWNTEAFPGTSSSVQNGYLITPFWDNTDISREGSIYYETHSSGSNIPSNILLQNVSNFISTLRGVSFAGSWMLIAMWDHVHPYPHGSSTDDVAYPDLFMNNTFQGIVITDGVNSYAVFTFKCGELNWSRSPTIGFNAASDFYQNHELTGSPTADSLDCFNFPTSDYYNVVYNISVDNVQTTAPPVTVEPPQASYLEWVEHTAVNAGEVDPCDDCSSEEIQLPVNVPFGKYYHQSIYIGTNGIISFGVDFPTFSPALFPTSSIETYYDYAAAPYWSDNDARLNGRVSWEMYAAGASAATDEIIARVNTFVRDNYDDNAFVGTFMFVGFWEGMHPYPAGEDPVLSNSYLNSNNTYQAIIITDTTLKTYAIYTYKCGLLNWAGDAIIGFNAAADYYANHYLSGLSVSNSIACVHSSNGSEWNNVIYNLVPVPGQFTGMTTPEPPTSIGTCAAAGYTECCVDGDCVGGAPFDCYCDQYCHFLSDCCYDIESICTPITTGDDNYLLFANHLVISRVNLDGSGLGVVLGVQSGGAVGIQFDLARNKLFYSDFVTNHIYSATLNNGSNVEVLLNDSIDLPEDLALDWVTNNLYWTDAVWSRIEVMDLDTQERAELVRTGNHSIPRAIVVDPVTRYMYWTDWGDVAKIERAGMDGQRRTAIIDTDLVWPNGLAIDYTAQKLYWADANLDKIEYSNVDGTQRTVLETGASGLLHPYALTIDGDLLYWTDWANNSIFATHKTHGISQDGDITLIVDNILVNPNGIEAITADKQPEGVNVCENTECSHLCLLSVVDSRGYSCACPLGTGLANDSTSCITTGITTPLPEFGSCRVAGYSSCCESGYCAGYPANCLCDRDCHARGDCCADTIEICPDYSSYLLFANHYFIVRANLDGSNVIGLRTRLSAGIVGIDFDLDQKRMFYSDYATNQLLMANLDGSNEQELLRDNVEIPESLAYDWVSHNLYWTDAFWARIEVMDLNSTERGEVLRTGANTVPRGIVVDPVSRYLYWTDWGTVAKIERASLDGQNRMVLIDSDLVQPNDITLDYTTQRLYWVDSYLKKLEYSNLDGSGRVMLTTNPTDFNLGTPYSLTVEGDYLYWSEWDTNSIYSMNKMGGNVSVIVTGLFVNPNALKTVGASQRPYGVNKCASNGCTHLCLLSNANSAGFSCICPIDMELASDGVTCNNMTATPPPVFGSCSHYTDCCDGGYCAGYPPNCFCDHNCHSRGDCCRDVADTCPDYEGSCRTAGYETCCTSGVCVGLPDIANCYCDLQCLQFNDCCKDFYDICPDATPATPTTTIPAVSSPSPTSSSSSSSITSPTSSSTSSTTTTSSSSSSTSTSASSTPIPTQIPADRILFQLLFRGIDNCTSWVVSGKQAKIDAISSFVANKTASSCSCQFKSTQIGQAILLCDTQFDKNSVTYRATLDGTGSKTSQDFLSFISEWMKNTDEIVVVNTSLKLDKDCPIQINSFDEKTCAETGSQSSGQHGTNTAAVAAPVTIILILAAAVVAAVVVLLLFFFRRKHTKTYDIFGGEAGPGSINNDNVSGSTEGASFKKASLAFKGEAAPPPPPVSHTPATGVSYQNPIYVMPELVDLEDDTLPLTILEKPPLSPEMVLPPTHKEEEKVDLSAQPFVLPSALPPTLPSALPPTLPFAAGYTPAEVTPEESEEPRYATVLPKSKRAIAKPFANDEDYESSEDEL